MKTALVCIAKDEEKYIEEWAKYHLKLGFDHIYVYANDWYYIPTLSNMTVIPFDGFVKQVAAYNAFKQTFNFDYNWAAFFDVDEFLVLKQHTNIKDFLADYNECNAIGINWAVFGNNGHNQVVDNNYSVLNRLTRRSLISHEVNCHIKTITRLPCGAFQNVHSVDGYWFNLKKEKLSGAFSSPADWSIAQLNHYFSKSDEELAKKCARGRSDNASKRDYAEHTAYLSLNDEEDLLALNFFNS